MMVRLNKTYGNLMVDVRASNLKLIDRAARIVMAATDSDRNTALRALHESGWQAKTAILMLKSNLSPAEAAALLEATGGSVRAAMERE
jgi:N-acetylmuramic acid 6-phosphate etherase